MVQRARLEREWQRLEAERDRLGVWCLALCVLSLGLVGWLL